MNNKNLFLVAIFIFIIITAFSQNFPSIHREESEFRATSGLSLEDYYLLNKAAFSPRPKSINNCNLNKIVFGWHPYWNNGLEGNYDWSLLSDLSYFAYEVNPSTGQASNLYGWDTVSVVTTALANGVRVNLCATLFSNHATFFGSSSAQQTLITNLINKVQQRGAHGVNIDFESVPSANKNDLTNFMINLCNQMHAAIPGSKVSMALPAVDWSATYDVAAMMGHVDLFLIMGYDYYYNGSSQAGPTDPLYTHVSTYNYNVSKSVTFYLDKGVPNSKLALGLPYYGREWPTNSSSIPSNTSGTGVSRTYKYVRDNSGGNYANPVYYLKSMSTYHVFQSGGNWRQCFINDAHTLGRRYDFVNQRNLAGIGIWALGHDDGYGDLWDVIKDKFTDCAITPCSDTLYDMGGPEGNYFNKENYTFTISPTGASDLTLTFNSFNVTAGSDTLKIYNGNSVNAPLIGNYTGTNSPGIINASGNALTLSFKSGASTTASGWMAIWNCSADTIPPTTDIATTNIWVNDDFVAHFNDFDNTGGSGVGRRFYQVAGFDGNSLTANHQRGFFYDNFNALNSQLWITPSGAGAWSVANNMLQQSDETNSNTNIYAPVNQMLSNSYLYHFNVKIEGTDNNKRYGFHFFCDSAEYTNRKNSYFIWFREATNVLEFYKVNNDVFSLVHTVSNIPTVTGQWYDVKVVYDRIIGEILVYRNNALLGTYTDSSPFSTNGNYISFRSGNCQLFVDSINVYRTRTVTPTILVGNSGSSDLMFESPDLLTPAGRVKSVVTDIAYNISTISSGDIFVDYSPPASITWVNDGLSNDIDTTNISGTLSANWDASSDNNTGIVAYWYAIGTQPGDTSVLGWTNNGLNLSATHTGLNLVHSETYYFSIKAKNGAGFFNMLSSSDGQMYFTNAVVSALFSWSLDSVCTGESVSFVNLSSNANSYEWSFQGGTPTSSTDINPVVTYNSPGTYQVQLIAYGTSSSDTLTLPAQIHVFQNTMALFASQDTVYLPNAIVAFQNSSSNATQYLWDFGDGSSSTAFNPWHMYDTIGEYVVTLWAINAACSNSFFKTITVLNNAHILEYYNQYDIKVYPNPFLNDINISLNIDKQQEVDLYISDVLGKKIRNILFGKLNTGIHVVQLDNMEIMPQGVYFVNLIIDSKQYNYKVIKL